MKPVTVIGPFAIGRQRLAFADVLPVARRRAAHLLGGVELVDLVQFLIGVAARRLAASASLYLVPCSRASSRSVRKHQLSASATRSPILVEEIDMVDLLDRAAGEAGLVLDQVLQVRLGRDLVVAQDRLVPGPVGAGPHRVHAGQPADVARDDAVGREQEARQRDDAADSASWPRSRDRTTAGCRRRCRARSGGCCRASPRGTTARACRRSATPMRRRSSSSAVVGDLRKQPCIRTTFFYSSGMGCHRGPLARARAAPCG